MRLRRASSVLVAPGNPPAVESLQPADMAEDLSTLSGRIAWAVRRHGGGHAEIAAAIGVERPMISMWQSGKRQPQIANLRALAEVLGVSASWLLDGDSLTLRDSIEADLMAAYRALPDEKKGTARQVMAALKAAA